MIHDLVPAVALLSRSRDVIELAVDGGPALAGVGGRRPGEEVWPLLVLVVDEEAAQRVWEEAPQPE